MSSSRRAVPIAKKPTVTPQDCEDFDVDTHQSSQNDNSSDEDLMKTAFTRVPPLKKKGKNSKNLKGFYIHYMILIHI